MINKMNSIRQRKEINLNIELLIVDSTGLYGF